MVREPKGDGMSRDATLPAWIDPDDTKQIRRVRLSLMKQQGNRCYLCDRTMVVFTGRRDQPPTAVTLDHVVPLAAGGGWNIENLAAACFACNQAKGDLVPATTRKGEKRQARQHQRHMKRFAQFQTQLHCGIPLRGGWL